MTTVDGHRRAVNSSLPNSRPGSSKKMRSNDSARGRSATQLPSTRRSSPRRSSNSKPLKRRQVPIEDPSRVTWAPSALMNRCTEDFGSAGRSSPGRGVAEGTDMPATTDPNLRRKLAEASTIGARRERKAIRLFAGREGRTSRNPRKDATSGPISNEELR